MSGSVFYVYYEQYLSIGTDTVLSLTYSLLVLFVVTTALNGLDVWASVLVSTMVVMILVEMMAVMTLWGITLNALSMVNLVVAMGIAVEFNSHLMHAFQKSVRGDRKARALDALVNTGSSVGGSNYMGTLVIFTPRHAFLLRPEKCLLVGTKIWLVNTLKSL